MIATHNPGKSCRDARAARAYGIGAVPGELDFRNRKSSGTTFAATRIGAAAAGASGNAAFADDSGIGGRRAGGDWAFFGALQDRKRFSKAMEIVEAKLRERGATSLEDRRAHFVSALCVAWPDGHVEDFEAQVDGTLVWPPRGVKGFGYDPMFLPDGFARTFGEMDSEEKHGLPPRGKGLSHRARAFPAGRPWQRCARLRICRLGVYALAACLSKARIALTAMRHAL